MRFTTLKKEEDLAQLARRLYELKAKQQTAELQEARRALLELNPRLADMANLEEGEKILVPSIPRIAYQEGESSAAPVHEALERLREALAPAAEQLAAATRARASDPKATLSFLRSKRAEQLGRASPNLRRRLAAVKGDAERRTKELAELKKAQKELFDDMRADLNRLLDT